MELNEAIVEDNLERDNWNKVSIKEEIFNNMGCMQSKLDFLNKVLKLVEEEINTKGLWNALGEEVKYVKGQIKSTEADLISLEWDLEQNS